MAFSASGRLFAFLVRTGSLTSENVGNDGETLDHDIVVDNGAGQDRILEALAGDIDDDAPVLGQLDEDPEACLDAGRAAEPIGSQPVSSIKVAPVSVCA